MKVVKAIGLFLIVISLITCGQARETEPPKENSKNWKSFEDDNYSVQYPEGWDLNTSGQMGTSFMLFSPASSAQDQFRENVILMIEDLSGQNIDLDKYVKISEGQIKRMITDGKVIESQRIVRGSSEFQKIVLTGRQGIFDLKTTQYYCIKNNKAYILTFSCEEDQYDVFKVRGEMILNSFRFD